MSEQDLYSVKQNDQQERNDQLNIVYTKPTFFRRVMANVIDFAIFVILFLTFFFSGRAIYQGTNNYKTKNNFVNETRLASGLYVHNDARITDFVTFYTASTIESSAKVLLTKMTIEDFIIFLEKNVSEDFPDAVAEVQEDYDNYRLEKKNNGINCFVVNESGRIVENFDCGYKYADYLTEVYFPYISDHCQAYLIKYAPNILKYTTDFSRMYFMVLLPVSFILAGPLTWLVPPFIFKRGRKTIGKLVYQIGAVDSNYLNLSTKRFLARFSIFFFGILCLSFVTFGIPMIISFSMMSFSKKRQSFPDYMLNIQEIETIQNKVYFSKQEILLEHLNKDNSAENFKNIERI